MRSLAESVADVIKRLGDNRNCPKYQFERASEVLISPFLEEWLSSPLCFGKPLSWITMEFPIKKIGNRQSTNADCLFYTEPHEWILTEIKAEAARLQGSQLDAYSQAASKSMEELFGEISEITEGSNRKAKYEWLKARLGSVEQAPKGRVSILYITAHLKKPPELEQHGFHWYGFHDFFDKFTSTRDKELWSFVCKLRSSFVEWPHRGK